MDISDKGLLSIGEVSRSLDITRRIILNYEEKGLITEDVKNGAAGNRYYTTDTLTRIRTIRVFQNLGLSLDDIKAYFDGTTNLVPMIKRLEKTRDEINLNIEKLKERVRGETNFELKIMELPEQKVYRKTLRAPTVDIRKTHLRTIIPDAMRRYGSDTGKRMYFIEYPVSDTDLISYCIVVPQSSVGEDLFDLPSEKALCIFYHGSYESIPKVRDKMIAYAEKNGIKTKGVCRHIYLEGPAQHREEKDFITQVALPIYEQQ